MARPNRLERITNLLLALLDTTQPLSLREIGTTVAGYPTEPGALRQAFERDKRTLRDEGIPIATERIDGDDQVGYRILPEQYYLPDLHLAADEQEALAFALAAVRLDAGTARAVGDKLGTPQSIDLPPVVELPTLPALGPLQEAIRTRSMVQFDYHGRSREVAGYALAFKWGSWYFIGNVADDGGSGELRTFRVDRMIGTPMFGDAGAYEVPTDFELRNELQFVPFLRNSEATEVTVDVDARDARRVLTLVGRDARIDGAPTGSVRVKFGVADIDAFVSYVLSLGDAAVVVAPKDVRDVVIARLHDATAASADNEVA